MLILTRKEDESIMIGNEIEVAVVDVKGDQVKLGIKAPKDIKVYRREVFLAIQKENLAAAKTGTSLPDIGIVSDKSRQDQSAPASTSASSGGEQSSPSQSGAGNSGHPSTDDSSP